MDLDRNRMTFLPNHAGRTSLYPAASDVRVLPLSIHKGFSGGDDGRPSTEANIEGSRGSGPIVFAVGSKPLGRGKVGSQGFQLFIDLDLPVGMALFA